MVKESVLSESDFSIRIKWLMFLRILFSSLLLGSTMIVHFGKPHPTMEKPLIFLYGLIAAIFFLSVIYTLLLRKFQNNIYFGYVQVGIDTVIVSIIIFLTGSYYSLFSFLYLVVIIYASMLLYRKGSMIMAALCSIQYGVMVDLEYYAILRPFGTEETIAYSSYLWSQILYKVLITIIACFAVAFLSSVLAEQAKESRKELQAMEAHVKRVEKMAIIGEMAAGLAHEIKNPLASLRGAIQMLTDDLKKDETSERLLQIVMREADRLNSLVNDFLLFARPPRGKSQPIDLQSTIAEIVDLFEKDCKCHDKIKITLQIPSNLRIDMDPMHFKQILWNLLLNSAESIENSGEITITAIPIKSKHVAIKITDSGKGIPPDIIKSIFDPFYTTKPNGSGLGLSIVHRIIESYNGRIDVESVVNKGTSFTIKLKRSESELT